MNAVIINQDPLHLEVGALAVFLVGKLDESILKAVTGLLVSDDLTRQDLAKTREDKLEVFIPCNWIELADK